MEHFTYTKNKLIMLCNLYKFPLSALSVNLSALTVSTSALSVNQPALSVNQKPIKNTPYPY